MARSTEKDITGFFEKSACDKAFSDFFYIFFLLHVMVCDLSCPFFIENRKRYHPNQVNFISPKVCPSGSKYPDSISWNGMCFFAKDEPSCPQYSSTSLRTSE